MRGTPRETGRSSAPGRDSSSSLSKSVSRSGACVPKAKAPPNAVTEHVLARVETVRLAQRQEGNFDCFATAKEGHCDQDCCLYRTECLDYSQRMR